METMNNNQSTVNTAYTPDPLTEEPHREYTPSDTAFAWICLIVGYVFCRSFPANENPLGAFLMILGLYGATAVVLRIQKRPLRGFALALTLSAVVISLSLVLCADATVHLVSGAYALATYLFVLYTAGGNRLEKGISSLIPADYFRALFLLPFASLADIFFAVFYGRGKTGVRVLLKLLLGVLIAIVPTGMVVAFLAYDSEFVNLMKQYFTLDLSKVFSHVVSIIWGVPVAMYLFGGYVSAKYNTCKEYITVEQCRELSEKTKVISPLTVTVAMIPVLIVYVVFFMSQWNYYVSGFMGKLPEMTVYSQYARDGFFQLCSVSVVNFVLLAAMALFTAKKGEKITVAQHVLAIILSLFTLVLIATAIAKMMMYIDCYGLTPKRVQASWFMLMLAAVFVLVMVGQFFKKLKLIPVGLAVCVTLYTVLALSGIDGYIARYNVDRYLNGTLDDVDIAAMEDLGDAAIPHLVYLVEELDKQNGTDITQYEYQPEDPDENLIGYQPKDVYARVADYLYETASRWETPVFSYTVPRANAEAALERIKLLE